MAVPRCRKCGTQHYNLISCLKAAQDRAKPKPRPVEVVYRSDTDRQWGESMDGFQRAGRTFWRKRDNG